MEWLASQFPWLLVALGVLVLGFFGYREWRSQGLQAAANRFLRLGLLIADRAAELTPTEKDNKARDFAKGRLRALGYNVDGTLEDELKALLPALWQEYKVEDLGIPAHVDGKEGKAILAAIADRASKPPLSGAELIASEERIAPALPDAAYTGGKPGGN